MCTVSEIRIQPATVADLDAINTIITDCVMNWDLPERVKRLAVGSYHYDQHDLEHLEILIAIDSDDVVVGVLGVERTATPSLPDDQKGMLMHGLYVAPRQQRMGIGRSLIEAGMEMVRDQELDGMLVKAQADANDYFRHQGFIHLSILSDDKDYPYLWWKQLASVPHQKIPELDT